MRGGYRRLLRFPVQWYPHNIKKKERGRAILQRLEGRFGKRFTRPKYANIVARGANFVSIKSGIGGERRYPIEYRRIESRGSPFFKKPFLDRLSLMALLFFFSFSLFFSPSVLFHGPTFASDLSPREIGNFVSIPPHCRYL